VRAISQTVCASILLYSYQVEVKADPDTVAPCPPPNTNQSTLTATVFFHFKLSENVASQIAVFLSKCDIPIAGVQSEKTVEWSLTDELPDHGELRVNEDSLTENLGQGSVTDELGEAKAVYVATDPAFPQELRSMLIQKYASGYVKVKVLGLLPDEWSRLEVVVRALRSGIGEGSTILGVYYWEPPKQATLDFRSTLTCTMPDVGVDGPRVSTISATVPLQLTQEIDSQTHKTNLVFVGQSAEDYESFTVSADLDPCTLNVNSYSAQSMGVRIPLGTCDPGSLIVKVHPGDAKESVTISCPQGPSQTLAMANWVLTWWLFHSPSDWSPGDYFDIGGWQSSSAPGTFGTFARDYNRPLSNFTGNYSENTSLKLTVSP
jgi:hypothetical protein